MKELIEKIDATLEDNILDKVEREELKKELHEKYLSKTARIQLINHATKIALAKANADNFKEVMQWLRRITILLGDSKDEPLFNNAYFGPDAHRHDHKGNHK